MVLPILNFCARDLASAVAVLEASHKLDGQLPTTLWLATDDASLFDQIKPAASRAFRDIQPFLYGAWTGDRSWPQPQNHAWQTVCRHLYGQKAALSKQHPGWLWWEPDATPLRAGWLTKLSAAYKEGKQPFAGVPCGDQATPFYLNGVAIYPFDALERLANTPALYARQLSFDRAAGDAMRRHTSLATLMHTEHKTLGGSQPRHVKLEQLAAAHPAAVFYHGVTLASHSASLPKLPGRSAFYHSGDLGDIIYSLPTIRELGGGELFLGPDNRSGMATRAKLTPQVVGQLAGLLDAQPYIHSATYADRVPEGCSYDLNAMRLQLRDRRLDQQPGYNLARCYLATFNLALSNDERAWLEVPDPHKVAPVVIARSPRYHNPAFDWKRVLAEYGRDAIFVGSQQEHAAFCSEHEAKLPHHPTATLLELAQLIAGADLFIGNQSCPYAIAEGLKKRAILEAATPTNCFFKREDVTVGVTATTELPIVRRPCVRLPRNPLVMRGPVDMFSGFGYLLRTLATGLAARGHKLVVTPSMVPETSFQPDIPKLDPAYAKLLIKPQAESHFVCSMHCGLPRLVQGGEVVLTMWEATRIAPATRDALNAASRVIVPSTWAATSFSACGVDSPISLLPLGVDTQVFKHVATSKPGQPFTFGTAGRLAHGGCRKGIEDVIAAFQRAFPPQRRAKVQLRIKCFKDCPVPATKDSRIKLDRDFLTDEQLAAWYNQLDCYVSGARAEGWGYHPHQAMACGVPVIAPQFSAVADYFDDSVGWPVSYELVPASDYYEGKGIWAKPSVEEMASLMRKVADRPADLVDKRAAAVRRASRFSLTSMLNTFEHLLRKEGLL